MIEYIDTHSHLYAEEFDADRAEVIERAKAAGCSRILLPNIDEASLMPMSELYRSDTAMFAPMIGLHPTELPADPMALLDIMEEQIATLHHPYVAVGEVGIDLYWDDTRRDEQVAVFARQAEWSAHYLLPLMIHVRKAHREVVNTLQPIASGIGGGVFHCFSGSAEEARELLRRFPHFTLGIGGVVTFKNSHLAETLRAEVPLSHVVLETDAPYLAPTPHRGKRNEPAYIRLVIDRLAEVYDTDADTIARVTTDNAKRIFSKL